MRSCLTQWKVWCLVWECFFTLANYTPFRAAEFLLRLFFNLSSSSPFWFYRGVYSLGTFFANFLKFSKFSEIFKVFWIFSTFSVYFHIFQKHRSYILTWLCLVTSLTLMTSSPFSKLWCKFFLTFHAFTKVISSIFEYVLYWSYLYPGLISSIVYLNCVLDWNTKFIQDSRWV